MCWPGSWLMHMYIYCTASLSDTITTHIDQKGTGFESACYILVNENSVNKSIYSIVYRSKDASALSPPHPSGSWS